MLKIKEINQDIILPDKSKLLSLGYSNLTAEILLNRYPNKTIEEIKEIMNGSINLDSIKINELDTASQHLKKTLEDPKKKTLIITDYDCDGISSAVVSYRLLNKVLSSDRFKVVTNKRKYGNGVNIDTIKTIENFNQYDLLITADHGSSNNDVFKELKKLNPKLEIIVTDHHTFTKENYPEEAKFFINNQRYLEEKEWEQLKNVSGCFMIFILLYKTLKDKLSKQDFLLEVFPFLCITAISDVMSMDHPINRAIINIGLRIMNDDRCDLFRTIKWYCIPEKHYSVETIKYFISPLINTGNRQHCEEIPFNILTSNNPKEIIENLETLITRNNERKQFTNRLISAILASDKLLGEYGISITIKTTMGINGIIASKVGEIKQCPIICFVHEDGFYHGSCRSIIPNIDIIKILERLNQDGLLEKFGGHKEAAGCLVSETKIDEFRKKFDNYTKEELQHHPSNNEVEVFKILEPKHIKANNIINLKHLEPLGKDFESPVFYSIVTPRNAFSSPSMTFLTFEEISPTIKGVAFHNGRYDHAKVFNMGNTIGIVYTMKFSYFRGVHQCSLNILNAEIIHDNF